MEINKRIEAKVKSMEDAYRSLIDDEAKVACYINDCLKWATCPECGGTLSCEFKHKWFTNNYSDYNCNDIQCGFTIKIEHIPFSIP